MQSDELCTMELRVRVLGDGLLGGTHEYAPWLAFHGTFGDYKVRRRLRLSPCAPVTTEKALSTKQSEFLTYETKVQEYQATESPRFAISHDTRGDDAVWFELWCNTRDSGIAEIDARESRYAQRHTCCGTHQLLLYSVFAQQQEEKKDAFQIRVPLLDHKILEIKLREYAQQGLVTDANREQLLQQAAYETHKGVLTIDVVLHRLNTQKLKASIFGQPNLQREALNATLPLGHHHETDVHRHHVPHWHRDVEFYRDKKGHARVRRPLVYAQSQSSMGTEAFAPISYTSDKGVQQIVQSMERNVLMPYARHFLQTEQARPLYGPANQNVANLHLPMWLSKMGRLPVYAYWCHDPLTRQYASLELQRQDQLKYGFRERSEKLLLLMARSALRRHGMSVELFCETVTRHFSAENKATAISPHFAQCERIVASVGTHGACMSYYMADIRFVDESGPQQRRLRSKVVTLDSWDNTLLNGVGNSDDCEGEDNTCTTIIRAYGHGRVDLDGKWQSPLLNAFALYLKHSVIYDVGATVTSAYVDTNNNKVDLRKQRELPMVGDAMDLKSEVAGHCHALMGSLTDAIKRLEQGNTDPSAVAKVRQASIQDTAFLQRDAQRKMLVLEPTGLTDPYVLPLKETHTDPLQLRKEQACRAFMRHMHQRLEQRKENKQSDLSDMFVGEGMPYYVELQDPRRRVTPFYNEPVHGCSQELMRHDDSLSQFAFCSKPAGSPEWRYGCKIADMLRSSDNCALVTPFADCVAEWQAHVRPLVETMQHQLPLMAFGRYSDEDYAQIHSTYQAHSDIRSGHTFYEASDPHAASLEATEFEQLAHTVAQDERYAMVRLYTRVWRLQASQTVTEELRSFLASSPGLVKHAYYTERHLPQCDPLVEILCIVDVAQCHALPKGDTR